MKELQKEKVNLVCPLCNGSGDLEYLNPKWKQIAVLKLRRQGLTFQQISECMGWKSSNTSHYHYIQAGKEQK